MRLTKELLPSVLLTLLPLYSSLQEWGLLQTAAALVLVLLVRQTIVFYNIYRDKQADAASNAHAVVLETIHPSHYVEKVRWCMDYIGQPYQEEQNVGILGLLFLGRRVPMLKIPTKNIYISNSSDILRYLFGVHHSDPLVREFLTPSAEALQLEKDIDHFGLKLRRFAYATLFKSANRQELVRRCWGMNQRRIPRWQKWCLNALAPILQMFVEKVAMTTEEEAEKAKRDCLEFIKKMDALLSDGRQHLLGTESPTFVDFAFSAMLSLVLFPPAFGGAAVDEASRVDPREAGEAAMAALEAFKGSAAAKFAMGMFERYRGQKIGAVAKKQE